MVFARSISELSGAEANVFVAAPAAWLEAVPSQSHSETTWNLLRLRPVGPVEASVLDRLGDVLGLEVRRVFEIGNRAGYLQDAVMGAGA